MDLSHFFLLILPQYYLFNKRTSTEYRSFIILSNTSTYENVIPIVPNNQCYLAVYRIYLYSNTTKVTYCMSQRKTLTRIIYQRNGIQQSISLHTFCCVFTTILVSSYSIKQNIYTLLATYRLETVRFRVHPFDFY